MQVGVIAAVFLAIFIGELPDKSMFASLVMATRGRPFSVWLGAAAAFFVHVVIAVSIGVALFKILPSQVVDFVVGVAVRGERGGRVHRPRGRRSRTSRRSFASTVRAGCSRPRSS